MPMEPTIVGPARLSVRGGVLTVLSGESDIRELTIGAEPQVIGRSPNCALVLHDKKVSAAHAEASATEQGLRIRDLKSTNGTFLGDHRIVEVLLSKEATVRIGDTMLEYQPGKRERLALSESDAFGPLVGSTAVMRALFERLQLIAPTSLSVLIEGETGTGKEVAAQAIHQASGRADKPFVVVDCSTLAPTLAESALFGHEKGAFTGAASRHVSPFVEARGGTVFIDELGELPLDLQPKLLRVLAEQRLKSVGSNAYVSVDVRVLAATRKNLLHEINRGGFRDDLYFRIAEERIELPPLRARRGDVMLLVRRIMTDVGHARAFRRVSSESSDRLVNHDWPGNVRELRNLVKRALAYDRGESIDLASYLASAREKAPNGKTRASQGLRPYELSKDDHDRAYFQALYLANEGNVSEMARQAGVSRVTARRYVRRYKFGPSR